MDRIGEMVCPGGIGPMVFGGGRCEMVCHEWHGGSNLPR